ncbi:hypothetical protein P7K49_000576 [Saguinus oedipus]|uniref:Uncharacterized protein n=1 Tax=Saguinus oedipus TaxID=9490 RepID=A0ABQ9WCM0_SAGOE|nr:hypothetical protein P7K49_000576 [Saguinus oedipus]
MEQEATLAASIQKLCSELCKQKQDKGEGLADPGSVQPKGHLAQLLRTEQQPLGPFLTASATGQGNHGQDENQQPLSCPPIWKMRENVRLKLQDTAQTPAW